ncbi:MAG TPA: hypothetical protein VI363_04600 [Burkholderiales bacterium]
MRRAGIIHNRPSLPSGALPIAAALAGLLAGAPGWAQAFDFTPVRVEASYTSDSNVTRAPAGEVLPDHVLGARVTAGLVQPVSTSTRALFQGFVGGEKFQTYHGLSHNFIGGQGEYQYRSSGEFGAATYAAFLRSMADSYESNLRDGYRHAFGVTVLKPATDRVTLFGALVRNISDGKSTVFDARNTSLRGNADWSLSRWDTVYLGAEYRRGDSISTVSRNDPTRTLGFINTANAIIQDDAFSDTRDAYRLKATTLIASLGYNRAFGAGQAVDVSWRRAQSSIQNAVGPLSGSDLRYTVNQYALAYLVRF